MEAAELVAVTLRRKDGTLLLEDAEAATVSEAVQRALDAGTPLIDVDLGAVSLRVLARRGNLAGANFAAADVKSVLLGCDLSGADFSGANVRDCQFQKSDLSDTLWTGANIADTDFDFCDLSRADFRNVEQAINANINQSSTLTGTRGETHTKAFDPIDYDIDSREYAR